MILQTKPFDDIGEDEVQRLITDSVSEGQYVEYKESLAIGSDAEKKEFLADISAFANASGGFLVFGMSEIGGLPTKLSGLPTEPDKDAFVLRIENMIRDGIEPRIFGLRLKVIELRSSRIVLLVFVPKSWSLPHWVIFKDHAKFYSRNSIGKYPLKLHDLRQLFVLSETASQRIRNFRAERLASIIAGETPVPIKEGPLAILHIVPFSASSSADNFDVSLLDDGYHTILPTMHQEVSRYRRYNFDGLVAFNNPNDGLHDEYVQFFRNGSVEVVDAYSLGHGDKMIPSVLFEGSLRNAVPKYLARLERLGVTPPLFAMLSLIHVSGFRMSFSHLFRPSPEQYGFYAIERDYLLIPEVVVNDFQADVDNFMRPAFDMVWNACSWPRSQNYDEQGKWKGR